MCRYEVAGGLREVLNIKRNQEIHSLKDSMSNRDIAEKVGCTKRTVQRVMHG